MGAAIAAVALGFTAAAANIFRDRPLVVLDQARYPQFSFVGRLEREFISNGSRFRQSGTAVIVSPCYIITNRHVVFKDNDLGGTSANYLMTFRAGLGNDEGGFAGHTTATPVLWGKSESRGRRDYAIMKLHNCVGSLVKFGWAESTLRTQDQIIAGEHFEGRPLDRKIVAIGHPEDGSRNLLYYSGGIIRSIDPSSGMMQIDASVRRGQSGGAVFQVERGRGNDPVVKLVGITTAGIMLSTDRDENFAEWKPEHSNLAQGAFEILYLPDVKELLDRDKASFGRPNPAYDRLKVPLPP